MPKKQKKQLENRTCPVCSTLFSPTWYQHKYCSSNCVNKASYLRSRDRQLDRNYQLQKIYGISEKEYIKLFEEQQGVCAICKSPETHVHRKTNLICNLSVDHDHITGKVRGLLCKRCNMALGLLRDSEVLLENAKKYLNKEVKAMRGAN